MAEPGDVVTLEFRGARSIVRRPDVIVSSEAYHQHRPDVIVGVITSDVQSATAPTDVVLQDWQAAGLRHPSAFRCYLNTVLPSDVTVIGHRSDRDWQSVREAIAVAFGLPAS